MFKIKSFSGLISAFLLSLAATTSQAQDLNVSGATVASAIKMLGFEATEYDDAKGNPHFVLNDQHGSAKEAAVFMLDCAEDQCEDVVAYANFGAVPKMGLETINEWNHISTMLRSRLSRSDNNDITLSLPISFFGDDDSKKLARVIGLFLKEVDVLSASIAQIEK